MNRLNERLEELIDLFNLQDVVEGLAQVSRDKADHLRTNWNDRTTAQGWDRAANRLEKVATTIEL